MYHTHILWQQQAPSDWCLRETFNSPLPSISPHGISFNPPKQKHPVLGVWTFSSALGFAILRELLCVTDPKHAVTLILVCELYWFAFLVTCCKVLCPQDSLLCAHSTKIPWAESRAIAGGWTLQLSISRGGVAAALCSFCLPRKWMEGFSPL